MEIRLLKLSYLHIRNSYTGKTTILYWIQLPCPLLLIPRLPPLVSPRQSMSDTCLISPLIARFMGPAWGPSGAARTQVWPMLAPWTLLSGTYCFWSVCSERVNKKRALWAWFPYRSWGHITLMVIFTFLDDLCKNVTCQVITLGLTLWNCDNIWFSC